VINKSRSLQENAHISSKKYSRDRSNSRERYRGSKDSYDRKRNYSNEKYPRRSRSRSRSHSTMRFKGNKNTYYEKCVIILGIPKDVDGQ
jgi:hypothetical protein